MKHLLVDTNILLDLLIDRKPFSEPAAELFEKAAEHSVKLYASTFSVSNIYHFVRESKSHGKTIELLKDLFVFIELLEVDNLIVQEAINSAFNDFDNAVLNYCALSHSDIEAIVTRNEKDFKNSDVPVYNPMAILTMLS